MQEQITELDKQLAALLQEFRTADEFWEQVESMLKVHRVHGVGDLPKDVQRWLLERLTQLPHAGRMQLELMRLEQKKAELTALVAESSREDGLNPAPKSGAERLSQSPQANLDHVGSTLA